jgi:hypothetical protein
MSFCSSWIAGFKKLKDVVETSGAFVGVGDGVDEMVVISVIKGGDYGGSGF